MQAIVFLTIVSAISVFGGEWFTENIVEKEPEIVENETIITVIECETDCEQEN